MGPNVADLAHRAGCRAMTGVSGFWQTSVELSASLHEVQEMLEALLSPRTFPPSTSFTTPAGALWLVTRTESSFALGFTWYQQRFRFQVDLAPAPDRTTRMSIAVEPRLGNTVAMALSALGVVWLALLAIGSWRAGAVGGSLLFLLVACAWLAWAAWLVVRSPMHAREAAEGLVRRVAKTRD